MLEGWATIPVRSVERFMDVDDYHTCKETYVTLRIYHSKESPANVTSTLGIEPSSKQSAGACWVRKGKKLTHPISGWFLSSEGKIDSKDTAKHLRWMLSQMSGKNVQLEELRSLGWWMDISCFWDSESGHGGPTLDTELLGQLSGMGLSVWFDVYFSGALDYTRMVKKSFSISAQGI